MILKNAVLPIGYKAGGISCGIKKSGKLDLGLVYSLMPALTVAAFTGNKIQAAPVIVDKERLRRNEFIQAIIVNSGNANCLTGARGRRDAAAMADLTADALGIDRKGVLAASTGIIGKALPLDKVKSALPDLARRLSTGGLGSFARAIMTTDTVDKKLAVRFKIGSKDVTISASAKGAGMLAPQLNVHPAATMLAFFLTDAYIEKPALKKAASLCLAESFNSITIDGCMSTNDSVFFMSNGLAGNKRIKAGSGDYAVFLKALKFLSREIALMLVKDGEGATKLIRVRAVGARSISDARRCAFSVANSNLFKAAVYGENHNPGRIAAAAGSCGIGIKESDLDIRVSRLKDKQVNVDIYLNSGKHEAVVYTCDLSPEYVRINASYS
ncbi:MAG: bifunctional glutamate N-acetyltransferase/amino-acid acetyltransferase ArgJ [Candidatus Omnitrophica bacterium]|nr:bifunctional glutamate N-acetyltransferase/amino-acid acetyltransferase ArgJ [Candidatus Omnitrophota bacterium]